MDLGMFRGGKAGFWAWVVGPLALMAVVYLPAMLYGRHLNRICDQRTAVLQSIPEMNRQLQRATDTLKRFVPFSAVASDGGADLNQRIQKAAQQHGVGIRSLTTEKGDGGGRSGIAYGTVTLQGEGVLAAVINLLDDLQKPESLCHVDAVRLKVMTWEPERIYSSDIVLRCYGAPAPEGAP